jgi:hypothetical protein
LRPSAPTSRRAPWLLPFELLALIVLVATVAFLRAAGLRVGWEAARYSVPPVARQLGLVLFVWAPLLHLGALVLGRRTVRPYLKATLLSPWWTLVTLRALIALVAISFAYMWLKVSIPLLSWASWDSWLWRADAAFHLGVSPNLFLVALFESSPGLVRAIDIWYALWMPTSLLGIAWFLGSADHAARVRVTTSVVLIYGLCSWLYLAMPAVGPCYVAPEVLSPVEESLPRQVATQAWLWRNYEKVKEGRRLPLRRFNPNLGVAAMPSMHVATHALIALAAFHLCRPLLVPAALGTFLTVLGSVLTGWHYALDGHAGLLLAALGWWASGPLCARTVAPEPPPATTAGPGTGTGSGGEAGAEPAPPARPP